MEWGFSHDAWGCCACQSKGWIGNCGDCAGQTLLETGDSYAVCSRCRGRGHLYEDLYDDDPIRGAVVVRVADQGSFFVLLGEATVDFGRFPPPFTSVRLADPLIAKRHFGIQWNSIASTHEVRDYQSRYSPTLNGTVLRGECRAIVPGDVLQVGRRYMFEYIAVRA